MTNKSANRQVTVIVRHKVRPGKETFFENWLVGIEKACRTFNGFMGTETIKPIDAKELHYVCIFRFDEFRNLEHWMESNERQEWLSKSKQFSDVEPEYEHYQHHGIEILLGNSQGQTKEQISPPKMILLTILGLSLPVHFIPAIVASFIQVPIAITLISLMLIVPMMVFLIMPFLVKLLGRWLF